MPSSMVGARSRSRIPAFHLERPRTVEAACRILAEAENAVVCAGGIDLINRLKRGNDVSRVVWIGAIPELKGVRLRGDRLETGAATTHASLATDALLGREFPELRQYIAGLGNVRIRAQGTIGGNLLAAEPAYEILPLLQVLDATLHAVNVRTLDSLALPARTLGRLTPVSFSGHLLLSISLPRLGVKLAWNRQMRPTLGIVAAWEESGGRMEGAAALAGNSIEPAWAEFSGNPDEAPRRWCDALPRSAVGHSADDGYGRRVAPVLLRRLLGAPS